MGKLSYIFYIINCFIYSYIHKKMFIYMFIKIKELSIIDKFIAII